MARRSDPLLQTRATLLARLKNLDDQTSWQTFFDTYRNLIYGVARQAGLTHAEAEDVLQETIVSVAKHMPNFTYDSAKGTFKGWLLVNVRRRAIGHYRKRLPISQAGQGDTRTTAVVERLVDPKSQEFEELWELEWQKTLLKTAMAKLKRELDAKQYQVFDFCVHHEWPPEKVAKTFGISVNQVYLIKHRVKEKIKVEISLLENGSI